MRMWCVCVCVRFPVSPITSRSWTLQQYKLEIKSNPYGSELLMPNGSAPKTGEIFTNKYLANTFRLLAKHGKPGFYAGSVAKAIVDCVRQQGGCMSLQVYVCFFV